MHKTFSKTKSSASKKDNTWQQTHQKQKRDKQNKHTHTHTHTNKELLMRQSIKQAKPNKQTNKQATKAWAMCL
jgi:hypothetical protein